MPPTAVTLGSVDWYSTWSGPGVGVVAAGVGHGAAVARGNEDAHAEAGDGGEILGLGLHLARGKIGLTEAEADGESLEFRLGGQIGDDALEALVEVGEEQVVRRVDADVRGRGRCRCSRTRRGFPRPRAAGSVVALVTLTFSMFARLCGMLLTCQNFVRSLSSGKVSMRMAIFWFAPVKPRLSAS